MDAGTGGDVVAGTGEFSCNKNTAATKSILQSWRHRVGEFHTHSANGNVQNAAGNKNWVPELVKRCEPDTCVALGQYSKHTHTHATAQRHSDKTTQRATFVTLLLSVQRGPNLVRVRPTFGTQRADQRHERKTRITLVVSKSSSGNLICPVLEGKMYVGPSRGGLSTSRPVDQVFLHQTAAHLARLRFGCTYTAHARRRLVMHLHHQ